MISITIKVDSSEAIREIELTGHAGAAAHGYDIVCAAVSSQVISVENSLTQLLQAPVEVEVNEVEGGYLKLALPSQAAKQAEHDAQLLLRHLTYALDVLADNYPEYIKITTKSIQ